MEINEKELRTVTSGYVESNDAQWKFMEKVLRHSLQQ